MTEAKSKSDLSHLGAGNLSRRFATIAAAPADEKKARGRAVLAEAETKAKEKPLAKKPSAKRKSRNEKKGNLS